MKFLILFLVPLYCLAQPNEFFKDEVSSITRKYDSLWDSSKETIVFTGSSSVRMWKSLNQYFPEHQILNTGFGGSQTIDLLGYTEELILMYQPKKVFIYEGDNDISSKKRHKEILHTFSKVIQKIKKNDSTTKVVIISAKPSISRWKHKGKYKRLNRKLKRFCEGNDNLEFANVWDIMLDRKKIKSDLFISDGLHMNEKGYQLWHSIIKDYID
ncbi:GDSL-type esterase/lipase family protein [Cellulophaga sp. L1A9]|uniref:GDSL-type esterase/lipase family protein n=1 Tax=Cellulophaga sp. L1A9 TaxID=2686362 RepID=UPI00131CA76F|nr:GDSL-type esterase/lipase family protein [Cellulophaga sp. L1A9]